VVIESVRVDNQAQTTNNLRAPWPREIIIPPGKEGLEIHWTSLNLAAANRARFKYRMEGFDRDWTPPNDHRVAYYGKLPPNQYFFRVTACNEDGVWNETGTTLAITVLPPFWQKAWFLASAALCLLGMVVGSVYYVSTQRLQRQLALLRQQEALEHERARIARDLHDQLGANLTQVALLGEMAETDKDLPAEVEVHARQISQTARDTTHALDEIVWTVNPANDTLDGLINYICKYAQEYLAMAGLHYRLEVPPELPGTPISPELRHNVFLGAKEAVNNVVKHSRASSAWLRLCLEPDRFILEIEDDGRGLSAEAEKKGRNGLRNMRQRMEEIGGAFTIGPGAAKGTLVRLVAPLGNGGAFKIKK
jgi:signal transduction histidine kinase